MFKANFAPFYLLSMSLLVLLPHLSTQTLVRWDEAVYAEIAREILTSGDWLTLHYNSQPWFEKPPLLFWGMALSYKLFGINEFAVRFPAVLACVGSIVLTYLIACHLYTQRVGVYAAIILLFSIPFVQFGRVGMLDMPLTFLCLIGVWAYLQLSSSRDNRRWYLIWIVFALATLLKWVAASVLPVLLVSFALLDGKKSFKIFFQLRHFWYGFVFYLLIIFPWHFFMTLRWGNEFWNMYLFYTVFKRMANPIEGHITSPFYYFDLLMQNYPWSILLIVALIINFWSGICYRKQLVITLLMVLIPVIIYSVCSTRLAWYILPAYPGMAILTAFLLCNIKIPKNFSVLALACGIFLSLATIQPLYVTSNGEVAMLAMQVTSSHEFILSPGQSFSPNPNLPEISFYSKRSLLLVYSKSQLIEIIKQKRTSEFIGEREWLTSLPASLQVLIHRGGRKYVHATLQWVG